MENNKKKQKSSKVQKKIEEQLTFTKVAICFVLINSELQIWASYVLAFLGRDAIAEALSQQIVITIIGTMVGYFIKSLVENLSKYTTLFGKKLKQNNENSDITNIDDIGMETEIGNDELIYGSQVDCDDMLMCDGITAVGTNENIII